MKKARRGVELIHGGEGRQDHEGNQRVHHAKQNRSVGIEQLERLPDYPEVEQEGVDGAVGHQQDAPAVDANQRIGPEGDDDEQHYHRARNRREPRHEVAEGIANGDADEGR